MDWTGLDSWTGQLDWTVGLDSWTGQLDWTIGLEFFSIKYMQFDVFEENERLFLNFCVSFCEVSLAGGLYICLDACYVQCLIR